MKTEARSMPASRPAGAFSSSAPPAGPLASARSSAPPSTTPTSGKPPSFLDEWLAKRKSSIRTTPPPASAPVAATASPSTPFVPSRPQTPPAEVPAKDAPIELATGTPRPKQGEMKIKRESSGDPSLDEQFAEVETVHIDKDGNISYEE